MLTGPILLQIIVILITVQMFGHLCKRAGQQWVIGEIVAGLALGPSLLGALLPNLKGFLFPSSALPTLQTLGDIGLILYMFSLGARLDLHLMVRQSRTAIVTSISGILLPLLLGMALAFFVFPRLAGPKASLASFMLLIGTAMAITAFPVLARLLAEKNMLGTRVGTIALTCAAFDDILAWCLLALVISIAQASGLSSAILTIGLTIFFIGCIFIIIRPLFAYVDRRVHSTQIIVALSFILLLLAAYSTNAIGIHPVFGAFLAGIILPRNTRLIEFIHSIDQINSVLFLPLYFVYSGLRTQIGLLSTPWLWLLCLFLLLLACSGKILGCMFAARVIGESWQDSFSLGILMNTRGLVELIVLNIGLDLGILSPMLFTSLVIMALVTTMMASPLLSVLGYKQKVLRDVSSAIKMPV